MDQKQTVKHSDFSIEHILNRAGRNVVGNSEESETCDRIGDNNGSTFQWLQYSRYFPPKIPRMQKKEAQKRQLGRHPRIPFTSYQLLKLEQTFWESPYISSEEVTGLSRKLQLADVRIKIWFQNRRARERREKNGLLSDKKTGEDKKSNGCFDNMLLRASEQTIEIQVSQNNSSVVNNIKSESISSPPEFSGHPLPYLGT